MFKHALEPITLGMPQLGPYGLSENWLLRHFGDVHWQMICRSLGRPSRDMVDHAGNRLYASFVRVCWRSTLPLSRYGESETLHGSIEMSRCGDGIFFSTTTVIGSGGGELQLRLATIFTRREGKGNDRLVTAIPLFDHCSIPDAGMLPSFLEEHRRLRADKTPYHNFMDMDFDTEALVDETTEYQVDGYHDLNGAKLLYFASYPTIADICTSRTQFVLNQFGATPFVFQSSPIGRDIFYFSNANFGDRITCGFKLREVNFASFAARIDLVRADSGSLIGKQFVVRELPRGAESAWQPGNPAAVYGSAHWLIPAAMAVGAALAL